MVLNKDEIINDTYCVEFFIGQGAFGEVYRVKHKFFAELQVMKVFKDEYVKNTDLNEIFNEGRILAKLTHSNIIRIFEVNTFIKKEKQYYFITMNFVSGESLNQLHKRKIQLPVPVSISIINDVLLGLNVAHKNKPIIVHRDISPDNILLSYKTSQPTALLGDFGLAQSLDQVSKLAGAAGKYLYFAPECFWNCYLPSSDVFSVGVVLYKILTGTHPWEYDYDKYNLDDKDEIVKMVQSSRNKAPLNPSVFNKEIDKNLEQVIMKSLEKDIENRYRTAGEFLKALEVFNKVELLSESYWSEQDYL